MNLAQVRGVVTDLRVLHIRPGAALLLGRAPSSDATFVARFERGLPEQLLSQKLLLQAAAATHAEAGCALPRHPNVATLEQSHVMQRLASTGGYAYATASSAAIAATAASDALLATAMSIALEAADDAWGLDPDAMLATRALQQAEAVRGAPAGVPNSRSLARFRLLAACFATPPVAPPRASTAAVTTGLLEAARTEARGP
eukprot:XP_001690581.1 predicted protein [Chlamydomonas reinhardtii]